MGGPRWLDERESRAWLGLMAMFSLLDTALDRQLQSDSGLSHAQYMILSVLSNAPDRAAHMSELATATSSSQSRLSHAMTGLESRGWVTRSRCPVNGRAVHANLTDAGEQVIIGAAPGHVAAVRELVFDHLSPDQIEALTTIGVDVLAALKDHGFEVPRFGAPADA